MWEDTMISGPSFDQADFFCGSPFIAAATHHSKDVLELLVENGVDVNKEVPGTYPTAYIATQLIFKKRWKIQNWLLEHGGSQPSPLQILRLNPAALGCIPNSFFHSPPDLALPGSFWGNMLSIFVLSLPSTIPYFLKSGADPHAIVPGSFYGSALLATASLAQPAALRTLLESGAQVNAIAQETTFGTPLIAACAGRVQFVSQFLTIYDRKEIDDDDDRDEDDWAQNQLEVIKELLFWKADPNLTYGCFSPLLVLVCSGSNRLADCVNLLLDAGAEQDLVLPRYSSAVSSLTRQLLPAPPFCFKVAPLPSLCSQILTLRLILGQRSRIRA
jgi:ankyrin repeat protein